LATALDGLSVVELGGGIAAAYATKLLADLGADVVKLEPPSGDPLRIEGGLWRFLNQGKRSALAGRDAALVAASTAVVVEALGPGGLEQAGLGLDELGARGFRGALVRISDFGQDGPDAGLPATDLTVQAMGGWVSAHGLPGHDPVRVGGRLAAYTAASFAAAAALTAWRAATDLGRAVTVDLSVMECLVGTLSYPMLFQLTLAALGLPPPEGRYSVLPGIVRCADGWAGLNALTGQHWRDVCAFLDAEEWAGAQRDLAYGGPELARFFDHIQPQLDTRTVAEVVDLAQAFRIPAAPVADGGSLPSLPPLRYRDFYRQEAAGPAIVPGPPYRLSVTPASSPRAAPRLGADTDAVVAEARTRPAPSPGRTDGVGDLRPFAGLRVIDLTTFWAGPYATMYLGSLGADVVKVESVARADGFRFSAAFPVEGDDWYERSGLWQATNLDKRGITLDLGREEGRALLGRLVAGADVVVENFSPRVVEQFGLGWPQVHALAPAAVMVRMPGFGLEGPWRDYVGWAMAFEQASGMAQVTGDGSRPINPGGFLDPVVGMHAVVAIQAALDHRRRTGEGQLVEIVQVEVGACLTAEQVIAWSTTGEILGGRGNRSVEGAPEGVYRCTDDGEGSPWIALSVRDDDDWSRLVDVLGRPPWALDPGLDTVAGRRAAHDDLDGALASWTAEQSPDEVVGRLRAAALPSARLLTAPQMYDDPQLLARGYYEAIDHPVTGIRRYPSWPARFSFLSGPAHRRGAPTLGQHNQEVLGGELGLPAGELASLATAAVIGWRLVS
jgi:crotonobetainyl-CoA:carnitine CoA-transferase CaiB-like acyl-CoA transferase